MSTLKSNKNYVKTVAVEREKIIITFKEFKKKTALSGYCAVNIAKRRQRKEELENRQQMKTEERRLLVFLCCPLAADSGEAVTGRPEDSIRWMTNGE